MPPAGQPRSPERGKGRLCWLAPAADGTAAAKIIVCLGRIAAKIIIKEDFRITAEHGRWFERGGVQMTAIYHPSALLRDVSKRPETFEDLKSIQAKIRELSAHAAP